MVTEFDRVVTALDRVVTQFDRVVTALSEWDNPITSQNTLNINVSKKSAAEMGLEMQMGTPQLPLRHAAVVWDDLVASPEMVGENLF